MEAIIFDLWGTLCYNDMATKRHEDITEIIGIENKAEWDRMRREYWGLHDLSSEKFFRKLQSRIQLKEDMTGQLVEAWEKQLEHVHRFPETAEVLGNLKERGVKLGIVSNTLPITGKMLDILEMRKFFDAIILSYQVGSFKPSHKIYQKALNKLKVKPEDTLFVGNELVPDFITPRKLGMKSILVDRNGIIPHSVKDLWAVVELFDGL